MTFVIHEVRTSRTATPVLARAIEPVPGLFVYEQPDELKDPAEIKWRIGHHSGLVVAVAIFQEDAVRGAQLIAGLADWTQSADELRASVQTLDLYDRLADAACEHPVFA
ncbi:hypothetical protein [Streptomyces sp. NPDC101249]|uniref:hypothetical protein n=1 Tax=Streptomyces sp. NPDC101249 TaxID=3366140 RepID=UPI00380C33E3